MHCTFYTDEVLRKKAGLRNAKIRLVNIHSAYIQKWTILSRDFGAVLGHCTIAVVVSTVLQAQSLVWHTILI